MDANHHLSNKGVERRAEVNEKDPHAKMACMSSSSQNPQSMRAIEHFLLRKTAKLSRQALILQKPHNALSQEGMDALSQGRQEQNRWVNINQQTSLAGPLCKGKIRKATYGSS
jgi:hypothetical protein